MKTIELAPIKETTQDFERIEKLIKKAFREVLFNPLMGMLTGGNFKNARTPASPLLNAIKSGRIAYENGRFTGKFSAEVSAQLKRLGATWDKDAFVLHRGLLPLALRKAIATAEDEWQRKISAIDKKLTQQNVPAILADSVNASKLLDSTILRTDRSLNQSLKALAVTPELTSERRERIALEWENNLKLWIKDFTAEEIVKLREEIRLKTLRGVRRDEVIKSIQKSYDVSANKAKFLARQETSLMLTKFKETRYQEAGVNEYKWRCVVGSKLHPVRPSHKILDNKIFSWNDPPITTAPGETVRRNNPGQDYNCRCTAVPIVRFKME